MRILVLPSWYPPQGGGFFKDYCEAFHNKGLEIHVIALETCPIKNISLTNVIKSFKTEEYIENGIKVLRSKYIKLPKFERLNAQLWSKKLIHICEQYIRKYPKPDIIHVHSAIWAGLAGSAISKKYQIPLVITEHRGRFVYDNPYAAMLLKDWQVQLLSQSIHKRTHFITVSNALKKTIDHKFSLNKQTEVIGNFTNVKFFTPDHKKGEKFTFLTVANFEFAKGLEILLEAFSIVQTKIKGIRLIIGGDGELMTNLKKASNRLNLSESVTFPGKLSKLEVKENMASANVFVLPSRFDAFGVVILEAMACGLPVISTNSGGPEDVISNNSLGLVVEKNNPQALANAMLYLYNHYKEYNSTLIRSHVVKNYSTDIIINKYLDYFRTLEY